ncbi:hypothetical protein [Krasilnikovia sp. MM14-A1004]|uniref:hypothetical protein n=1 Tax=Krasilnikovia sp. MM14-A1004 TaxID=3373541 RepID=UPI00399C6555
MNQPDLPRRVEQTRALLLLQMYLTLLVLLFMTLLMQFLTRAMGLSRGDRFVTVYVILLCVPFLLGLSAWMFRRGMILGWILAFVAEVVSFAIAVGSILGPFTGIAAIILLVVSSCILVNLFRPEVRRYFF